MRMGDLEIDKVTEYEYRPSYWVKTLPQSVVVQTFIEKCNKASAKARETFDVELDIPYGSTERTKLDIYKSKDVIPTDEPPVFVFYHGGYWKECSKTEHGLMAFPVIEAGGIAVIVGYDLAPQVTLDEIVNQTKLSLEFVAKRFPHSRLYLIGHSAGAHLAAMMMTFREWSEPDMPHRIRGMCLISGVYELTPLLRTNVNEALKMNEADAIRNSPCTVFRTQPPTFSCTVVVLFGEDDSPAFHKQSKELVEVLKSHHLNSSWREIPGADHFSVISDIVDPEFETAKEIRKMISA